MHPFASRIALAFLCLAPASAQILTSQYDDARTGATLTETKLTPAAVNVGRFGKIFSLKVDGDVYAQPLFLPRVEIPAKGVHNVIFIATEHNSVYAFDAEGSTSDPLWHVNLGTPVPFRDVACPFIRPEIGITPTPVIDLPSGTLYILARTKEANHYIQRLHALAITTGAEKFGGPVEIKAKGKEFDPLRELPRAGLALAAGQVYLTWGSSCDVGPYSGWVMTYDAKTLAQTGTLNTSPVNGESGIWQSDNAPAVDAAGNVYVGTGNGKFTLDAGGSDYGDSALKISLTSQGLGIRDYFTPYDEQELNRADHDLGSGGPMLLPDQPGEHPHLLAIGGKDGRLYLLDRDKMGKHPKDWISGIVQSVKMLGGIYAAPAYWNGHLYILPGNDFLRDYPLEHGKLSETPITSTQRYPASGATPAISANGKRDGILWFIESKAWNGADKAAVLHAYDASNVTRELYNSEQNSARDRSGTTLRFTIPTVVNGRVYVNAKGEIDVYGQLPAR